jgi:hypothetical protein
VDFIQESKTNPDLCYTNENIRKRINYVGRKEEKNYSTLIPNLSYTDWYKSKWKNNASVSNQVIPNQQPHVHQKLIIENGAARDQR